MLTFRQLFHFSEKLDVTMQNPPNVYNLEKKTNATIKPSVTQPSPIVSDLRKVVHKNAYIMMLDDD